jgi:hypothetical protein
MIMFAVLTLFGPVVVPCFLGISRLMDLISRRQEVDMSDISFDKSREQIMTSPDSNAEMNYVSIREAVMLSDRPRLRRLLIDILKYNAQDNLQGVALAMDSQDSETAHYAASSIQDALNEFRNTTQNLLLRMRDYPEDVEINLTLLEYIYHILTMKIMALSEQHAYIYTEDAVAENLFSHNKWFMTAEHYLWMTRLMIEVPDFETAKKWVERAGIYRPNELETYKARLQLYYAQRHRREFFSCLEEFKHSTVTADQELLDLIRLYK